jgi:hypothetical protein
MMLLFLPVLQFADLHLEMRGGKLGLDFTEFDKTISSTGQHSHSCTHTVL